MTTTQAPTFVPGPPPGLAPAQTMIETYIDLMIGYLPGARTFTAAEWAERRWSITDAIAMDLDAPVAA